MIDVATKRIFAMHRQPLTLNLTLSRAAVVWNTRCSCSYQRRILEDDTLGMITCNEATYQG
jgi:hypothetical protein